VTREPDLDVVNRTLSAVVQKQEKELAHLRGAMQCAAMQLEQRLYAAAHQTIVAALGGRDEQHQ
jgi:hypothetical protein